MPKPSILKSLLQKSDPRLKNYVVALESENAKLQRQIAKLEVNQISDNHRIKALEKELKKQGSPDLGEILRETSQRMQKKASHD